MNSIAQDIARHCALEQKLRKVWRWVGGRLCCKLVICRKVGVALRAQVNITLKKKNNNNNNKKLMNINKTKRGLS